MIDLEWAPEHPHRGPVALVVLNRPERRNALTVDGLEALAAAVATAVDRQARVLVLTGAGGMFCAGADLDTVVAPAFAPALRAALDALADAPLVTIAAVEGAALGAGTQLALACDLRTATATARFGIPAAKLGLVVDHATVARLSRFVGPGLAASMLLAAEELSGARAFATGFVQRQCDPAEAVAWAEAIAALAPLSVRGHKLALRHDDGHDDGHAAVAAAHAAAWASADLTEGRSAFAERRPPRFQGA